MKTTINYIASGLTVTIFIYILVSSLILAPLNEKRMLSDYFLVSGQFTQVGKNDIGVNTVSKYKFNLNKQTIISKTRKVPCKNCTFEDITCKEDFKKYRFPVAISKIDSTYSVPLLTVEDFKLIDRKLPDSLRYIYDKYFDCSFIEKHTGDYIEGLLSD